MNTEMKAQKIHRNSFYSDFFSCLAYIHSPDSNSDPNVLLKSTFSHSLPGFEPRFLPRLQEWINLYTPLLFKNIKVVKTLEYINKSDRLCNKLYSFLIARYQ